MEQSKERTIRYLQEAYALETHLSRSVRDWCDQEHGLNDLCQHLLSRSESQADRLKVHLETLGQEAVGDSEWVGTLCRSLLRLSGDSDRALLQFYTLVKFESELYHSLHTFASTLGDEDTARLAREIELEEELSATMIHTAIEEEAAKRVVTTAFAA